MIKPKIFCTAPWDHLHVTASQYFMPCCRASYKIKHTYGTAEEWMRSAYMNALRLSMIKNEPPEEVCKACIHHKTNMTNGSDAFNLISKAYIEELLASTNLETGETTWVARTVDFRIPLCNLRCKTCGWTASTAHRTDIIKFLDRDPSKLSYGLVDADLIQSQISDQQLSSLVQAKFAGGEPFLSKTQFQLLERLKAVGNNHLALWYSTNGTFPAATLQKAISALSWFKDVSLGFSIDAVDQDFSYIRKGADFNEVWQNMLAYHEANPHHRVCVDFTCTSLGLLTIVELAKRAASCSIPFIAKIAFFSTDNYLSINSIKPEYFYQICDDILEETKDLVLPAGSVNFVEFVAFLKDHYVAYDALKVDYSRALLTEQIQNDSGYFQTRMENMIIGL